MDGSRVEACATRRADRPGGRIRSLRRPTSPPGFTRKTARAAISRRRPVMPSHDRRAAGRRRAWGRGPIILKLESLERRALMAASSNSTLPDLVNSALTVSNSVSDWNGTLEVGGRVTNQGASTETGAIPGRLLCVSRPRHRQVLRPDRRGDHPGRPGPRPVRPLPDLDPDPVDADPGRQQHRRHTLHHRLGQSDRIRPREQLPQQQRPRPALRFGVRPDRGADTGRSGRDHPGGHAHRSRPGAARSR